VAYEQRDMSGTLFRNEKGDNDRRPDYTGKALIDGEEYRIAAWVKEGRGGKKFLSLSFSEPRENDGSSRERDRGSCSEDEDIPFSWLLAIGLAGWSSMLLGA
jgi:hypothetical protein